MGFVATALLLTSCEQSTDKLSETDDVVIKSIINISDFSNTDDVEEATSTGSFEKTETTDRCFTVTILDNGTDTFWPRSWTLDYGTENCEGINGVTRRGKVHVSISDFWRNEGSLRTITYEDFYVNDVQLAGTKTIENTGLNDAGNMTWTRKMADGKLSFVDGTTSTWNSERFSEQVEGGDTRIFRDNVFLVTGGGSGNIKGIDYSVTITSPLRYQFGCRFPVSGELSIEVSGAETTVINFGDGECDTTATKTVGEVVTDIVLGN